MDNKSINLNVQNTESNNSSKDDIFHIEGDNEPYLGASWAVLMLVLYALKTIFPATQYTFFWWFQLYIVSIVIGITIFTLFKRHKYFQSRENKEKKDN